MKKILTLLWMFWLSATVAAAGNSLLDEINGEEGMDDEPLSVEEAFKFSPLPADESGVTLRWEIAPKHYLYRHAFEFTVPDDAGVRLGEANIPAGEKKEDQLFGTVEVYHGTLNIHVPFERVNGEAVNTTMLVKYQGCAARGICYPPQKVSVDLVLAGAGAVTTNTATTQPVSTPEPAEVYVSEENKIINALKTGNFLVIIPLFFGIGIGLAFTACMYPMLPILSGIIVGQGEHVTTRKAFILSLVYVLAMSVVFAIAGVIAGMTGDSVQVAMQNPWVLTAFSLIFVVLALSMFGFFELQMPSSIQSKITQLSNQQQGGVYCGGGDYGRFVLFDCRGMCNAGVGRLYCLYWKRIG
jgi:thioredoxin:protein disulfide reductase